MSNVRHSASSAVADIFNAAGAVASGLANGVSGIAAYSDALSAHSEAYVAEVKAQSKLRILQAESTAARNWAIDQAEELQRVEQRIAKLTNSDVYADLLAQAKEALKK